MIFGGFKSKPDGDEYVKSHPHVQDVVLKKQEKKGDRIRFHLFPLIPY
jgi:hypothetical protein